MVGHGAPGNDLKQGINHEIFDIREMEAWSQSADPGSVWRPEVCGTQSRVSVLSRRRDVRMVNSCTLMCLVRESVAAGQYG